MQPSHLTIQLHDMEFYAYHGVLEEEKQKGNTFLVNIHLQIPVPEACHTDQLDDTLNYQIIYDIVAEEMNTPSELLEHLVWRIRVHLLTEFPQISQLRVRVSKKNPPLGGNVPWVSVEV